MEECCVLFSGGIDSTTALYWALDRYKTVQALTFDYGQRHEVEIRMSRKLIQKLDLPHTILSIDLQQIKGSALTDPSLSLPEFQSTDDIESGVPSTYVPFRNGIFLALSAAWAEVHAIEDIVCGFNVFDSPNYPDTTSDFVQAMERAVRLGTKAAFNNKKVRILAPFVDLKKSEIIRLGLNLGADYAFAISCYAGSEIPCFRCSSCLLRQRAWKEAGQDDPLLIRLEKEGKL